MKHNFSEAIKFLVSPFWENGKVLDTPKSNIKKLSLSPEKMSFVKRFVSLLMESSYTGDYSKIYYADYYISISEVHRQLVNQGNSTALNCVKNQIRYTTAKIKKHFGESMALDILTNSKTDISPYVKVLNSLYSKYVNKFNVADYLIVDTPSIIENRNLTDWEFNNFLNAIEPYSKFMASKSISQITNSMWGYFWYLVNSRGELAAEDNQRYLQLLFRLGLYEHIPDFSIDDMEE